LLSATSGEPVCLMHPDVTVEIITHVHMHAQSIVCHHNCAKKFGLLHTCTHTMGAHTQTHTHAHTPSLNPQHTCSPMYLSRFLDYGEPTWKAEVAKVLGGLRT